MGRTIRQEKVAVLREGYFKITGNVTEAMILNQMIYWSRRVADYDKFIKEENSRRAQDGKDEINITYGWIHKTASELKEEIMSDDSLKTIARKLEDLVARGFLDRRNNPDHAYDRTYQYRVNLLFVYDTLNKHGYQMEGFKAEPVADDMPKQEKKENNILSEIPGEDTALSICHGDKSNCQTVASNCHCDKWNCHGDAAIPETTAENTTEITSSPSYYPSKAKGDDEDGRGEVSDLLTKIGINNIRHKDMIEPMSRLIAELLRIGKAGQTKYSRAQVKDALGCLCACDIDTVIDRYTQKAAAGEVLNADSFLKACLVSAGNSAKILKLAKKTGSDGIHCGNPSFNVDEYVRLSMMRLQSEQ
jgi:hypothetical protein